MKPRTAARQPQFFQRQQRHNIGKPPFDTGDRRNPASATASTMANAANRAIRISSAPGRKLQDVIRRRGYAWSLMSDQLDTSAAQMAACPAAASQPAFTQYCRVAGPLAIMNTATRNLHHRQSASAVSMRRATARSYSRQESSYPDRPAPDSTFLLPAELAENPRKPTSTATKAHHPDAPSCASWFLAASANQALCLPRPVLHALIVGNSR